MKCGLIYKYENKINGKIYIGQTCNSLKKRHKKHLTQMRHNDNDYFHRALKKYGFENFTLSIVEDNILLEELDDKEIYYIKQYDSYYTSGKGYNMTKGGKWSTPTQIIFGSQEKEIKKLLLETNLSFTEIAKKLNLKNIYSISSINCGDSFREKGLNYPLRKRKSKPPKKIDNELYTKIVNDILNTDLSFMLIAEKYDIHVSILNRINQGKHHLTNIYLKYPLREPTLKSRYNTILTKEKVIQICKILLFDDVKIKNVCERFNVKKNTIGDISCGKSWKDVTNGFIFPLIKNKIENQIIFLNKYGIV